MFLRASLSLALVATFLMALFGSYSVTAFTATPSKIIPTTQHISPIFATPTTRPHQLNPMGSSSHSHHRIHANKSTTTSLHMNNNSSDADKRNDQTYGMENGRLIFILVIVANIWMFSIPPEFRRARFCKEEDVQLHPESKCTTFASWREGIAEYYANGGGVEFDFSVEGKE